MANFPLPPIPFAQPRRLQPELLPSSGPIGSFIAGVGAGQVTATGTQPTLTFGQGFGVGAGQALAAGYPTTLSVGQVQGFNVGAGNINAFGYFGALGTSAAAGPSTVTPTIAPFAPALSELSLDAWERVGKQANELNTTHLNSMRRSMNLVLSRWANNGLNLWEIANQTITLIPGVATYALPATLIEMLDTYISTSYGGVSTDIIITPMSRNTYAALPNKLQPGRPILYWFDRTITPSVTVWPVPDLSTTYTMPYFGWSQIQDADVAQGNTANIPYRFLEAFTACVASHLAMKWAPERAEKLKAYSDECFAEAADEDHEISTLTMVPDFGAYFS